MQEYWWFEHLPQYDCWITHFHWVIHFNLLSRGGGTWTHVQPTTVSTLYKSEPIRPDIYYYRIFFQTFIAYQLAPSFFLSGNGLPDCFAGSLHLIHLFYSVCTTGKDVSDWKPSFWWLLYGSYSNFIISSKIRLTRGLATPTAAFLVGGEGLEPPVPKGSGFTVHAATNYRLPSQHINLTRTCG